MSTDHHPILYKAISSGDESTDPCIPGLAWEPAKKDYPFTGWEPLARSDLHAYRKQMDVNFTNMQNHMDGDEQILSRTIDDIIGVACSVNHTTKGLKNWQLNQPTVRERSLLVTVKCHPEDAAAATELKALKKSRLDQRAKEKVRSCSTKRAQHALPDRLLFEGKEEFNRDIWSDHLYDYMCKRFKEDHCDNGLEVQCARVERAWLRATIHGDWAFWQSGARRIRLHHLLWALSSSGSDSAGGSSKLVWEMLQQLPFCGKLFLVDVFNNAIVNRSVCRPDFWREAILQGLPKVSGAKILDEFRWIGLCCVLQKLLKILTMIYRESIRKTKVRTVGFSPGCSTSVVTHMLSTALTVATTWQSVEAVVSSHDIFSCI